jgi:Aerotolerance regulator N-terminal/von Willebrand factor type A domain
MEFLNPGALYGLLALPLLLIPYLIRRKPQRVVFSSLLLFTEPVKRAGGRPLGKLRLPLIFFLQLLLLTLLVLALGEPVFSLRASNIAIVLDNSASMQTRESQQTRFALAQEKARELLAVLGATGQVDLYLTAPRLEKVRGATFGTAEAAGVLAALTPYDLADTPIDYQLSLSQMAKELNYDQVFLITDHPAAGQTETLRVITVGQPRDNFAVSSFNISHASLVGSRLEATAEVANFSTKDERITIALRGGGAVIASRELSVGAGKTAQATFGGFPAHSYYEVEIDVRDALPLDNRRFAVPPAAQSLRILGVSPRPQALSSLRSIAGVSLDLIAPHEYDKIDRSGYGLEIFHYAAPPVLPGNPTLFVLPPDNNPLVELERPVARPAVSSWREPHPLTRYVNFALFRPAFSRPLRPRISGETIIESPAGPLVFAAEGHGLRQLALGFDIFPYLGRENLPVSVFTLNLLDWFFHGPGVEGGATGAPLTFSSTQQGNFLLTPRGDKITLNPGANNFPATYFQGVYQVDRGAQRDFFAVNLKNPNESDLRRPTPIELRDVSSGGSKLSALFSIWPYLLLTSLLLLLVEWFINPRPLRTRAG